MERTIRRLTRTRYLCFVLFFVLCCSILGGAYHGLVLSRRQTLVLRLGWSGAEKGLNPDGSRFRLSELTCDEVLDAAKAGLSIAERSNEEIREELVLSTSLGAAQLEEAASKLAAGGEAAYVPTTLRLTYVPKDLLGPNESGPFLRALAENCTAWLSRQHGENNTVLSFDPDSVSGYDASAVGVILSDKTDRMLDLLRQHSVEGRTFRSESGQTFGALQSSLTSFRDVTLTELQATGIGRREALDQMVQLSQQAKALDDEYLARKTEQYITFQVVERRANLLPFAGLGLVLSLLIVCRLEFTPNGKAGDAA